MLSTTAHRRICVFEADDFKAFNGRVRPLFYELNSPYMHLCSGLTAREGSTVLACWGWVLDEPWVAIANDLFVGQLKFVMRNFKNWLEAMKPLIWGFHILEDDEPAARLARFVGYHEAARPQPGIVRYERAEAWQ